MWSVFRSSEWPPNFAMATGAYSRRWPARSRRLPPIRSSTRRRAHHRLLFQKPLEYGSRSFNHSFDQRIAEFDGRGRRLADDALAGQPRVVGHPRPGRPPVDDQSPQRLGLGYAAAVNEVAPHQLRRQDEHHRGLALAAMDVAARWIAAGKIERMQHAVIEV